MTSNPTHLPIPPDETVAALRRLVDTEISLPSRLGHVALLLAALAATVVIGSLWLTEPVLPPRAHAAFALMVVIGVSWVVYAAWVLTHRRILLARHGIVAGRMAVTFTALFTLGALAAVILAGTPASYAATAAGLVMLAAAVALLVRAHSLFARLSERRNALEREMGRRA